MTSVKVLVSRQGFSYHRNFSREGKRGVFHHNHMRSLSLFFVFLRILKNVYKNNSAYEFYAQKISNHALFSNQKSRNHLSLSSNICVF